MSETKGNFQGAANGLAALHKDLVQVTFYCMALVLWHAEASPGHMHFEEQPFKNL